MGIPSNVMRYVWQGTLPQGEIWQTGCWFQGNLPSSNAAAATAADLEMSIEAGSTASSFWNAVKSAYGAAITLDRVKVYAYPTGGPAATFVGISSHAPIPGTGTGAQYQPNQIACVASLLTGTSGRSFRGRMYWPSSNVTGFWTANTLSYTGSIFTAFGTAVAKMLTDYKAIGQVPVVVSQTKTVATPITTVVFDSRADVQRRRANKQTGIARSSYVV